MKTKEQTFEADVIQYLRPNGRKRYNKIELPIAAKTLYKDMEESGCRFEAEILKTGEVSVTITNEEQDVDISLTENGPEVIHGVIKMLNRKLWENEIH